MGLAGRAKRAPIRLDPTKGGILKPRIYLDLDGVVADFDAHFPVTFGVDHRKLKDDEMWAKINGHPSYFGNMPPCCGALEFFAEVRQHNPIILTACPKSNYAHVARQKRAWVREHLSTEIMVLPILGGVNKPLFMHAPGDILIDDFMTNARAWEEAGGRAILHRSFPTTRAQLHQLLREPAAA
jgi:5'-nucleotidase